MPQLHAPELFLKGTRIVGENILIFKMQGVGSLRGYRLKTVLLKIVGYISVSGQSNGTRDG